MRKEVICVGKIVFVPKTVDKKEVYKILQAALHTGTKDDFRIKRIFSGILDYGILSNEISSELFYSRTAQMDDRKFVSMYFYYNPSKDPFAWMSIYYSSYEEHHKLFGAQFSYKGPRTTEMLIEELYPPDNLGDWISVLKNE